jgi:hypothetical protein
MELHDSMDIEDSYILSFDILINDITIWRASCRYTILRQVTCWLLVQPRSKGVIKIRIIKKSYLKR